MITFLFSPWGIPANYRQMQGSGVHAYKWVNEEGKAVLVKYHFEPKQGIRNLTQKEAEEIQGKNFNHATQDLYEAIEKGDYPEWEVYAQIMTDDEHPELDFDPLDPTKLWYKDDFPWKPIGKLVLNKTRKTTMPRWNKHHSERACLWTALIFQMTNYFRDGHSPIQIPSGTASAQITCSSRSTRRKACRHQPGRRANAVSGRSGRRTKPARQL